ncbi:cation:proton antiporter [Candidatus Thalassolituus haligoni]|jgi:predicted Kef-type K+ transport protein|uniref:cation:proton antiporter domain-containing protein n=1 Tax=Candidatus Thalassolituus haligoni TaxID=3100113 RepID=UPI00351694F8|tara:strand:+ start:8509 stop:10071 length:1563 start_codon:yes stop_codon:yes gene_type:complete
MDFVWILVAFLCGFAVKQLGMPPLVGYLLAGFGLNAAGMQPDSGLNRLADLGITLMLFTIGLKLNIKALLKTEVWATSVLHTGVWTVLLVGIMTLLGWLGISHYLDISWQTQLLIGFALSFSSTVCVIKMLEESSELKARHGKIAVGILVIQDIVAVIFLVASTGKVPSIMAFGLLGLWLLKPLLHRLVSRVGHDELLPLLGFFLALGGAELFTLVHMKGDLGALLMGMLLASHGKSAEIYKALMGFKDLFLIGFFLSIGFTALPTLDMAVPVLLLTLLLLLKFGLFFVLMLKFRVSGRASYLSALALTNFSEFGLIVANLSVAKGWLSNDWLVIIAVAMSLSFVISAAVYRRAHHIYALRKQQINRYERSGAHPTYETPVQAEVLILGMGRVGKGAYKALEPEYGHRVCGVESDPERVAYLKDRGLNVVAGDADDMEFWECIGTARGDIRLVMMALPSHLEMRSTLEMLRLSGYQGKIAAVARYDDERQELLNLGVDVVFNYYSEVGAGFAAESRHLLV